MKSIISTMILSVLCASTACAEIHMSVSNVSGQLVVTVSIVDAIQLQAHSVNIESSLFGECDSSVLVLEQPLELQITNDLQVFEFVVPSVIANRLYNFKTKLYDDLGNPAAVPVYSCSPTTAWGSQGEAIAFRVHLLDFGNGIFEEACADHCWLGCGNVDYSGVEADLAQYVNTGQLVNVIGEPGLPFMPCTMPGTSCFTVTRLELEDDPLGCGSVNVEFPSWGALKCKYR